MASREAARRETKAVGCPPVAVPRCDDCGRPLGIDGIGFKAPDETAICLDCADKRKGAAA